MTIRSVTPETLSQGCSFFSRNLRTLTNSSAFTCVSCHLLRLLLSNNGPRRDVGLRWASLPLAWLQRCCYLSPMAAKIHPHFSHGAGWIGAFLSFSSPWSDARDGARCRTPDVAIS